MSPGRLETSPSGRVLTSGVALLFPASARRQGKVLPRICVRVVPAAASSSSYTRHTTGTSGIPHPRLFYIYIYSVSTPTLRLTMVHPSRVNFGRFVSVFSLSVSDVSITVMQTTGGEGK